MSIKFSALTVAAGISYLGAISVAWAWPPTYGSEYNFSSHALSQAWNERGREAGFQGSSWQVPADAEKTAAKQFADHVRDLCGAECTITPHTGKFDATEFSVQFASGYKFNISIDPSCVEIQTEPETLEHIREFESTAQKFIFGVANELGLTDTSMSAHFNIGIQSAFEDDPKGFLRFFTSFQNNAELTSGALGMDFANAPPLSHLKPEQRAAFAKIVNDVNSGKLRTLKELTRRIQSEVYTSTPTFDAGYHYQGISIKYVTKWDFNSGDRPFELRGMRQPETAHERTLLAELFEKRMAYESKIKDPIAFEDLPKISYYSNSDLANAFRIYLLEMGEDFDHFKDLLPRSMQSTRPDSFISGEIDWKSNDDIALLKFYAKRMAGSAWIRGKMRNYLLMSEAKNSPHLQEVLTAIKAASGENASASTQEILALFSLHYQDPEFTSEVHIAEPTRPQRKGLGQVALCIARWMRNTALGPALTH